MGTYLWCPDELKKCKKITKMKFKIIHKIYINNGRF